MSKKNLDLKWMTPDSAAVRDVPAFKTSISKGRDVKLLPIGSIIVAAMDGTIVPYENNRGRGSIREDLCNQIKNNLEIDALGELTLCYFNDKDTIETYGRPVFIHCDWHNRMYGILLRYWHGLMTSEELRSLISVRTVSEHSTVYRLIGETVKHTARNKISNPMLAYGDVLFNAIAPKLSEPAAKFSILDTDKFMTNLSLLVWSSQNLDRTSDEWGYANLYKNRTQVKKYENDPAGTFKLKYDSITAFCKGLETYYSLYAELHVLTTEAKKIVADSSPLFGLVVSETMKKNPGLPVNSDESINTKAMAKNLMKRLTEICDMTKYMTHGTNAAIDAQCQNVLAVLNGRKPRF